MASESDFRMIDHRSDGDTLSAREGISVSTARPAQKWWSIPIQSMQGLICLVDVAIIVLSSSAFHPFLPLSDLHIATLRLDRIGILSGVLFAAVAQLVGAYDVSASLSGPRSALRAVNAWVGVALFMAALAMILLDLVRVSAETMIISFVVCGLNLAVGRALMACMMRGLRQSGVFDQRVAVFGTASEASALMRYIADHDMLTLSLLGMFGDDPGESSLKARDRPLLYLGNFDALLQAIRDGMVDRVLVALSPEREHQVQAIIERLSQTPVEVRLAPVDRQLWAENRVAWLGELPVITLQDWPLSRHQRLVKMVVDRGLAFIALMLVMPVMLIVAIAIKLDSPGPILFRQQREGFNCRSFSILKFRTMRASGDDCRDVIQAQRHDVRVTRLGAILRRTSLDERPQLINVLRGDMSLVGPRPHAPSTRAAGRLFSEIAQTYASRHNVKPGMTGWAQVCGWRGETQNEAQLLGRLEHDLYYVRHWSIWFDLRIMALTIIIVLRRHNAY